MKKILAVTWLLLVACGGEPREPEAPPAPESGVFDDLTGTIDRAEAVEQEVLEQKKRLDEALDAAAGDPENRSR